MTRLRTASARAGALRMPEVRPVPAAVVPRGAGLP